MASQEQDWKTRLIERFNRSPIIKTLGYHLDEVGEGWAITRLTAEEKHVHAGGIVHGGVLLAMADAAFTAALFSTLTPGEDAMITEMKINFMRPTWPGSRLEAKATVTYRGNRVAFGEVDIVNEESKPVAKCLGSALFRPNLPERGDQRGH